LSGRQRREDAEPETFAFRVSPALRHLGIYRHSLEAASDAPVNGESATKAGKRGVFLPKHRARVRFQEVTDGLWSGNVASRRITLDPVFGVAERVVEADPQIGLLGPQLRLLGAATSRQRSGEDNDSPNTPSTRSRS
jgi:hypothetical protein